MKNEIIDLKVKLSLAENKSASLKYDNWRLKAALQIVSEWNSLSSGFFEREDKQAQIDFYRQVAQDALDVVKKLEG